MHGCGWACASALRQQCGFVKCTPGGHTEQYQGEFLLKAWQGDAGAFVLLRQSRKSLVTGMVSWHKAAREGQTGSETGCDVKRLKLEQWAETQLSPGEKGSRLHPVRQPLVHQCGPSSGVPVVPCAESGFFRAVFVQ